jgi:hypothetical protein
MNTAKILMVGRINSMMEIKISLDEKGHFNVEVSKGTPFFVAIGMLEVATSAMINGDIKPTADEPTPEVVKE